jgi:hypothetical protein
MYRLGTATARMQHHSDIEVRGPLCSFQLSSHFLCPKVSSTTVFTKISGEGESRCESDLGLRAPSPKTLTFWNHWGTCFTSRRGGGGVPGDWAKSYCKSTPSPHRVWAGWITTEHLGNRQPMTRLCNGIPSILAFRHPPSTAETTWPRLILHTLQRSGSRQSTMCANMPGTLGPGYYNSFQARYAVTSINILSVCVCISG